jgi:hypothetical protein
MRGYKLSDFERHVIAPLLPNKPRGVLRVHDRRALNGMKGRAVVGSAEGIRPLYHLLQPLRAVAQSQGVGPHSGRRHNR